jgi:hypothetical protein
VKLNIYISGAKVQRRIVVKVDIYFMSKSAEKSSCEIGHIFHVQKPREKW